LWRDRREREKSKKKKIIEANWSSYDDNISIVENISMRRVQWHQIRSQMVNKVGNTSCPKMLGLAYFWAAYVAHSGYHWWSFLVSLDSFCQYFSNATNDIIIGVFVCLFFFYFSSYWICVFKNRKSQITDVICNFLN
jgi:apolipoprotein N-acyltransferase